MSAADWEAIERDYRAGVLSVRELAKQHGISEAYIRKKAKASGWERDLTAKVQEAVRTELVRAEVRSTHARTEEGVRTEAEIVQTAAAEIAGIVRSHRVGILAGRQLAALLFGQLQNAAEDREAIEEAIMEETADADNRELPKNVQEGARIKRAAMLRAVSLPAHAQTLKDLSTVLKNLIPLERQAFNVDAHKPEGEDSKEAPVLESMVTAFAAKVAAFRKPKQLDAITVEG